MPARLDPFIDVLLREKGDQLYLLPDEPVTMVRDGRPRKVSRQPLTDQHIYALLVEVAPSESADHIDQLTETEFEYAADRGLVRVRVVPDQGRLTAIVTPVAEPAGEAAAPPPPPPPPPASPAPRPAAIAAAPPEAPAPVAPPPPRPRRPRPPPRGRRRSPRRPRRLPRPSPRPRPASPPISPRRNIRRRSAPWRSSSPRSCARGRPTSTCAWASRRCSAPTARSAARRRPPSAPSSWN